MVTDAFGYEHNRMGRCIVVLCVFIFVQYIKCTYCTVYKLYTMYYNSIHGCTEGTLYPLLKAI